MPFFGRALALLALGLPAVAGDGAAPVATLEDLFGPTGNRFAGSIGFLVREANRSPEAVSGYGLGVDDVVVEWREFTLDEDASTCDTGSCATINLGTNNIFEGSTRVSVTVVDISPGDNDCDGDGVPDGTRDCNGNLIPDVVVVANSLAEPAGERVILDAVGTSASSFTGTVAISTAYDVPGTLFVESEGGIVPTIVVTYLDNDDGTGGPCQASVDPQAWGLVQAQTAVLVGAAPLVITRSVVSDNGDDDGWADTGETVRLQVEVANKSGVDLSNVTVRLVVDDPAVACVTQPAVRLGDLRDRERRFSAESFEFLIDPGFERTDPFQELTATLRFLITADGVAGAATPQRLVLDLDLDATGGAGPTTYFEGFESGFGTFTTMHIDESLNPPDSDLANNYRGVLNADHHRCQYVDPSRLFCGAWGCPQAEQCFPNPNGAPDRFWFHVTDDRAFSGVQSMAFNVALDAALGFTTPNSQLEAVRTTDPVNLGWDRVCSVSRATPCEAIGDCPEGEACAPAVPLLTFKHQISLLDHRSVNAQSGRAADRAVVGVQVADGAGEPAGVWIKAQPFVNLYDSQANSNYFNCTFDPADDGNTEDDYFDPADPLRSQGPSSTCAPGFSFADQGDTDGAFDPSAIGGASDGPGLAGSTGLGTWVEPAIDLSRFRGRRVRVRFLETGLKLGSVVHWEQAFGFNPDPGDDGWFIDDVTITDALAVPAAISVDSKDNSALPTCDARVCGQSGGVDVVVRTTPVAGSPMPGRTVTLDAAESSVDTCKSGVLQYRFWVEVDDDGVYRPGADVLLRDWTDNPTLRDTPHGTTRYAVTVRCATDPACAETEVITLGVGCPSSGTVQEVGTGNGFLHRAPSNRRRLVLEGGPPADGRPVTLHWPTAAMVDIVRGDLQLLRGNGGFGGGEACVADDLTGVRSFEDTTATPQHGDALFWLLRSAEACNQPAAGGSYGAVGESGARTIDACSP